jgi:hypothetical protein
MEYKVKLLERTLKEAVAARHTYNSEMAKLEAQKDTYTEEYLNEKKKRARQQLRAVQQEQHEEMVRLLKGLQEKVEEKHGSLNLDNMAYQSALKTIELAGSKIPADVVQSINSSLKGNMPALKALRAVYEAQGIAYTGDIDEYIYDIPATYESLRKTSYQSIVQEGSLNSLATAISKVVKKEGFEFPTMVDDAGYDSALRKAAGLE